MQREGPGLSALLSCSPAHAVRQHCYILQVFLLPLACACVDQLPPVCVEGGCLCVGAAVLVVLWSLWPRQALPSAGALVGCVGWCMLMLYCTISGLFQALGVV